MMHTPTQLLGLTIALGDNPDAIELDVRNGHLTIVLGPDAAIVLDLADDDTINKLATVAAEARVVKRTRDMWQVA
ncbi:hypothetical protein [Streptomyces sp. HC307]|uniref:hypothetical protein n=1 Tax=Streptomyces flavusporus TaxID=3385496 RepID=UPI003916DF54